MKSTFSCTTGTNGRSFRSVSKSVACSSGFFTSPTLAKSSSPLVDFTVGTLGEDSVVGLESSEFAATSKSASTSFDRSVSGDAVEEVIGDFSWKGSVFMDSAESFDSVDFVSKSAERVVACSGSFSVFDSETNGSIVVGTKQRN